MLASFLHIQVVNRNVPAAPADPDFDNYFAPSGFCRVQQLEEVDAATPDTNQYRRLHPIPTNTDDVFFGGIDPRVMSMFDLHVPNSAPARYDGLGALNGQVKAIYTPSRVLHLVSPMSCVGLVLLPRSSTLRCVQRTPMSSTVSSALTLTTGDDGSQTMTNDDSGLLFDYRLVRSKHFLKDAGGHKHFPIGFGYLRFPVIKTVGFILRRVDTRSVFLLPRPALIESLILVTVCRCCRLGSIRRVPACDDVPSGGNRPIPIIDGD